MGWMDVGCVKRALKTCATTQIHLTNQFSFCQPQATGAASELPPVAGPHSIDSSSGPPWRAQGSTRSEEPSEAGSSGEVINLRIVGEVNLMIECLVLCCFMMFCSILFSKMPIKLQVFLAQHPTAPAASCCRGRLANAASSSPSASPHTSLADLSTPKSLLRYNPHGIKQLWYRHCPFSLESKECLARSRNQTFAKV